MSRRIDTWMPIGTSSLRIEISNSKRGDVYLEVKQACGNNEILKPGLSSPLVLPSSVSTILPREAATCCWHEWPSRVYPFMNFLFVTRQAFVIHE